MKKRLLFALLLAAPTVSAEAVIAKERCFVRQERVCRPSHQPAREGRPQGVICTYRTKMQCFQVPEIRNKTIGFQTGQKR